MKNIKDKINKPTNPTIMERITLQFSKLDYLLLYCVQFINPNLFSFISGIIANIPISLLLNLISLDIECNTNGIVYLIFYILSVITSIFLCIEAFAFTLKHIDLNERARDESDKIIMNNQLVLNYINASKKMKKDFVLALLSGIMVIACLILLVIFHATA